MSQKTYSLKSLLDVQIHIIKELPDAPKLYVLKEDKSDYALCSLSYAFVLIGYKINADDFEYEITPSLRANDRLEFAKDVAFNHVREKGRPQ